MHTFFIFILRQFSAAESPLKKMKNAFYLISKALFVLKIFKFFSWLFGHVLKWLDKKDTVNFKFYDITVWLTNNYHTHIAQYLEKLRQSDNEIWSVKGTVKRAEPGKCDILLVSRTLWHKRITPSLKEWTFSFWYSLATFHHNSIIAPYKLTQRHSHDGCLFSSEKTCDIAC